MLSFKAIDKESLVKEITSYLRKWTHGNSGYTPNVLFMWGDLMGAEYAIADDIFYLKRLDKADTYFFGLPIGSTLKKSIPKVIEYAKNQNYEPIFFVPESALAEIDKFFDFTAERYDKFFDYIYKAEDLIELKGKKFHAKRNYINRFLRENPNNEFKELTKEQVPLVKEYMLDFFENEKEDCKEFTTFEKYERCRAIKVLDNYEQLGLFGGVLYVKGHVVGYTIGDIIGDTLFVHIEKGSRNYVGSYEYINNTFAKLHAREGMFINREDDAGSDGLRKAKESYNPIKKLYNYKVRIQKQKIK